MRRRGAWRRGAQMRRRGAWRCGVQMRYRGGWQRGAQMRYRGHGRRNERASARNTRIDTFSRKRGRREMKSWRKSPRLDGFGSLAGCAKASIMMKRGIKSRISRRTVAICPFSRGDSRSRAARRPLCCGPGAFGGAALPRVGCSWAVLPRAGRFREFPSLGLGVWGRFRGLLLLGRDVARLRGYPVLKTGFSSTKMEFGRVLERASRRAPHRRILLIRQNVEAVSP